MAVNTAQGDLQMVTFLLDEEEYGVDVMAVREIINMTEITKMANAPPHVEGIINLRGQIVPIVSLRKRFGLPDEEEPADGCIAVIESAGSLSGFTIDQVSDVIRVHRHEIMPPLDGAQPWIEGLLSLDQRLIVLMNLQHLV